MIPIKTSQELKLMREGGKILGEALSLVIKNVKPGITEIQLDKLADDLITKRGATPGFKKVQGYKHATCISTNNVVVHGIPTDYALKEGDVIGIDCGVFYKGFHTDMSHTVAVGGTNQKTKDFLSIGEKALDESIKQAVPGNRIGNISAVIEEIVEGNSYSVVKSLIGHGVGRLLHEEPEIPGYLASDVEKTPKVKEGMTLALEVIYNMGEEDVIYANKDGWTISTKDGSLSAVFERTIAVGENGPEVLTELL